MATAAAMHTAAVDNSADRGTWPFSRASLRRLGVACSVRSALPAMMSAPTQSTQELEALRDQLGHPFLQGTDSGEHHEQADHERDREAHSKQIQRRRGA